jgi:hypothetical protein
MISDYSNTLEISHENNVKTETTIKPIQQLSQHETTSENTLSSLPITTQLEQNISSLQVIQHNYTTKPNLQTHQDIERNKTIVISTSVQPFDQQQVFSLL